MRHELGLDRIPLEFNQVEALGPSKTDELDCNPSEQHRALSVQHTPKAQGLQPSGLGLLNQLPVEGRGIGILNPMSTLAIVL